MGTKIKVGHDDPETTTMAIIIEQGNNAGCRRSDFIKEKVVIKFLCSSVFNFIACRGHYFPSLQAATLVQSTPSELPSHHMYVP